MLESISDYFNFPYRPFFLSMFFITILIKVVLSFAQIALVTLQIDSKCTHVIKMNLI